MPDRIDTSQWQRLSALFDQAIGLDTAQQAELVRTLERDDAALAQALASLLAADARHQAATAEQRARVLHGSLDAIETPCADIGDRVGPYVLREILGRGGMGVVFRAERVDGQVRQEVALKIVRRPLLDAAGRERFHRERQIVAGFQHPCIARMLDVGQTADGSPYMAMELIRGPTITGYCYALKLDTRRRIEVFLDVCDAVHHAHANLVLHRDLKPGNVLIGQDGLPKLIDFGIAKPLTSVVGSAQQRTTTDHRFFSPSNVAPEQLRGEHVGVACDVYQLGTLLHELLCGTVVFDSEGLTPGQLEERIVEIAPEAPSARAAGATTATAHAHGAATPAALARELRGDLDAIVALALRKSPQERYASADHLADDLRRYLDGRPVAAMRGQYWYRTQKFVRRRALAVGAWMAVLVLVAALVTALWVQGWEIARARSPVSAASSPDVQASLLPAATVVTTAHAAPVIDACKFADFVFPADFTVYGAVGASGHTLDFDIARHGGVRSVENDLVVNNPQAPVALILGNAGPTLWNLSWTKGTRIVAVFVNGQSDQVVAGLPKDVPLRINTIQNHGACVSPEAMSENLGAIQALSLNVYGRLPHQILPFNANNATARWLGSPVPPGATVVSGGRTPESFRHPDVP